MSVRVNRFIIAFTAAPDRLPGRGRPAGSHLVRRNGCPSQIVVRDLIDTLIAGLGG